MNAVRVPTPGEGNGVDAFFRRCGLSPDARFDCLAAISRRFPNSNFTEASPQGYCSYTLCDAGLGKIVQFRPSAHRIDWRVAEAAREVYGNLPPKTEILQALDLSSRCHVPISRKAEWIDAAPADEGVALDDDQASTISTFQVLSMSMTPGISLTEFRVAQARQNHMLASCQVGRQRESLIAQFADFVAIGWEQRLPASDPKIWSLRGQVGHSMRWRLEQMRDHLPQRFRPEVQRILNNFEAIRALPWVLTHGDVVPANVMVKSHDDWSITGFLDWAEAEYLPFGVGLYGLEEMLGEMDTNGRFMYYPEAACLQRQFWSRLGTTLQDGSLVKAAHTLGVLLWHGIAFDDGKLNRVVDEGRDQEEIQRLDAFFASAGRAS